jgi:hypothetical protein
MEELTQTERYLPLQRSGDTQTLAAAGALDVVRIVAAASAAQVVQSIEQSKHTCTVFRASDWYD